VLPILERRADVVRELVRAAQERDQSELVVAGFRAISVLPDLVPWLASLYDVEADAILRAPAEELVDYLEGLVRGEDFEAFFSRLMRLLSAKTG